MTLRPRTPAALHVALALVALLGLAAVRRGPGAPPAPQDPARLVAVTVDDLPVVRGDDLAHMQHVTEQLVRRLAQERIPAVGFVNERQLFAGGPGEVAARTALLERWLEAGLELGNHTYSHPDLNDTPLDTFQADVLRGEAVTRGLLGRHGRALRYFRHPYLHAGDDARVKAALERFLAEHGYTIAPVTVDNDEWVYAAAYDRARRQGDEALMRRVGEDYLRYMDEVFAFNEQLSKDVVGREVRQILLIHANTLNGDYLGGLVEVMRRRGYGFVSLAEALEDSVYARPDPYVGPRGMSWLLRWAAGEGHPARQEPVVPAFVRALME